MDRELYMVDLGKTKHKKLLGHPDAFTAAILFALAERVEALVEEVKGVKESLKLIANKSCDGR